MGVDVGSGGYRVITVEECEERFAIADDIDYPYTDFADSQEIRLHEGGLHVAGHFESENDENDWTPYNTVVDGDLTVEGDLNWGDFQFGDFVVVAGSLRAHNVILSGCPTLLVRGDLTASGVVMGSDGSDGGVLIVRGRSHAGIVISRNFIMRFASPPDALTVGSDIEHPEGGARDEAADVLQPDLLTDEGDADTRAIRNALEEGRALLR
jgi:hypothetical protein